MFGGDQTPFDYSISQYPAGLRIYGKVQDSLLIVQKLITANRYTLNNIIVMVEGRNRKLAPIYGFWGYPIDGLALGDYRDKVFQLYGFDSAKPYSFQNLMVTEIGADGRSHRQKLLPILAKPEKWMWRNGLLLRDTLFTSARDVFLDTAQKRAFVARYNRIDILSYAFNPASIRMEPSLPAAAALRLFPQWEISGASLLVRVPDGWKNTRLELFDSQGRSAGRLRKQRPNAFTLASGIKGNGLYLLTARHDGINQGFKILASGK
jgi:hypothetical protein